MIERTPITENICVTAQKSEKVIAVIAFLFFLILWIFMIWNENEFTFFDHILLFVCMLFIFCTGMHIFRWRVTLDSHALSVRNLFGRVKTYELRQITKVEKEGNDITLYAGEKKIAEIPKKAKNADYLEVRLGSIPHLSYPSDK